jgi:hypothetical protein
MLKKNGYFEICQAPLRVHGSPDPGAVQGAFSLRSTNTG